LPLSIAVNYVDAPDPGRVTGRTVLEVVNAMSDSGEGLVDAEARLQEQIDAREQERKRRAGGVVKDPEKERERESIRLARADLSRQLDATAHPARRQQLQAALDELERRLADL
jgi:hypothetical protein